VINWIRQWRQRAKHNQIIESYAIYGTRFGDGLSYLFFGYPLIVWRGKMLKTFKEQLDILDALEEQYALLGYRIVPLQEWIDYGGWGVPIQTWLVKREVDERPQFTKNLDVLPPIPKVVRGLNDEQNAI